MSFVKDSANRTPIVDTVFAIADRAKKAKAQLGADQVIDATIGSLYNEEGSLATMDVVFDTLKGLDDTQLASYAASFVGNPAFRRDVENWVLDGNSNLYREVIATPGGTGAVGISIENCLDAGQTLIIPEIAWGSYALMAQMNNLKLAQYSLFEGDHFNIESFKAVCRSVMETQNRLVVIINDPCHNPTGYSLSDTEWKEIVDFLNECSATHHIVLINDIAYEDFSYRGKEAKKYAANFDAITDNVVVIIAFSISKSMTSYGLRCGAALILGKSQEAVDEVKIVFEKAARATWSNINNSAMVTFSTVLHDHLPAYEAEKDRYVSLLKERSDIFIREAEEAGLSHYPYKEGFFVTLDMDNESRDKFHEALMEENIYTVKVNKGIRVALCALPVDQVRGLAEKMKKIQKKVLG